MLDGTFQVLAEVFVERDMPSAKIAEMFAEADWDGSGRVSDTLNLSLRSGVANVNKFMSGTSSRALYVAPLSAFVQAHVCRAARYSKRTF